MHWLIIFVGSARLASPGCLAGFVGFLNPRVFPVRNTYLFLKEGEGFSFISSFQHLENLLSVATMLFLQYINIVLLGAAIEELIEPSFGLFFMGDLVYSLEEQLR